MSGEIRYYNYQGYTIGANASQEYVIGFSSNRSNGGVIISISFMSFIVNKCI